MIDNFLVNPGLPSTTLSATPTFRSNFCTLYPLSVSCPDGPTISATTLIATPTATTVANGVDQYSFVLKLRDAYGNQVKTGTTHVVYQDNIRTKQVSDTEYMWDICFIGTCALITGGDLNNNLKDGKPTVVDKQAAL